MIISRTPFRISFFGGGTDYPKWYLKYGGSVLATTIDKYCYLYVRYLPPFFWHKYRIVYSKIELVNHPEEIKHPAVREVLKFLNINKGVEIQHQGDLPARSGVGSSSSFTVGLLNALYALSGKMVTKKQLAYNAIYVEQQMIKEHVGSQDQTLAAFGGFNLIEFKKTGEIEVKPVILPKEFLKEFQRYFLLFFTGIQRTASNIAKKQIENFDNREKELKTMHKLVYEALSILQKESLEDFGKLLHETWSYKRSLAKEVSNSTIDEIYQAGIEAGALGGKLLGAGGGGFILFFAPPKMHEKIKEKLKKLLYVPFNFEFLGSQIIYYKPDL